MKQQQERKSVPIMTQKAINDTNKYRKMIKLLIAALLLLILLFLTGTFCDRAAAETLFSPDNTFIKVITSTGVYPIYAVQVLFYGALYERTLHSSKSKQFKMVICTFFILTALFLGFNGGKALASRNNLGEIFPSFIGNLPVIIIISAILEYPLFFIGYFYAKKSDDKLLTQRIFGLFIVLLFAFISMQVMKNFFDRPRYRTAVLGYEGITFVPWYKPFTGAEKYVAAYGINADEFRSFPSGHNIFSSLSTCIFPSLAWLFPKLKNKQMQLFVAGFIFCIIIMFTRMLLGAHYLSDVSAGAIIGVLSSIACAAMQLRISQKNT